MTLPHKIGTILPTEQIFRENTQACKTIVLHTHTLVGRWHVNPLEVTGSNPPLVNYSLFTFDQTKYLYNIIYLSQVVS